MKIRKGVSILLLTAIAALMLLVLVAPNQKNTDYNQSCDYPQSIHFREPDIKPEGNEPDEPIGL